MAKTEMLHARIDAELKGNVESIFAQLGMTSSEAIKLFYKQVELNGGLPFEVKIPRATREEAAMWLMAEVQKGEDSLKNEPLVSLAESRKKLGV